MVVLLQARLHAIKAVELDETSAHELFCTLVVAHADLVGFDLCEVLFDLLFGGAVGEVAWLSVLDGTMVGEC